jgi:phospholipase/carboxylesterase
MSDLDFIHRFVPAKENSTRTVLLLHGTGADENDLLDLGQALDANAALLSPRGKVLENGRPRFFRLLSEGVFVDVDVIVRVDLNDLVGVGYSNGANIAAAMMLLVATKFSQEILLRLMVTLSKLDQEPDLKSVRVLISAGEFDPIARPPIAKKLAELFSAAGADVTFQLQPSGHELSSSDVASARDWLVPPR